ncbi:hypothetical protein [Spiroplasma cantharicola]|uniref:Uncharacterized protein n=1 Tax=Spiroplasma cantharicola TaxID=362837 RepID=A0A0M4K198_9MOLU|nr:hypothetical protein [Spiroplasma cantharicola]ALD66350.1 hypothetical protein SCANT_v1c04440 [Spiroplasma cantharicola]
MKNEDIKQELDKIKIFKKNNEKLDKSNKKIYFIINFIILICIYIAISFIIIFVSLSMESQLFLLLAEILIAPIFLLIAFIFSFFISFHKRYKLNRINKKISQLENINWISLYKLLNENDFNIINIKLERQFIEYNLLKKLLITHSINSLIINNEVTIIKNHEEIRINFSKISLDEELKYVQLTQKIYFNRKLSNSEINRIFKGKENNIIVDRNTLKTTKITRIINLCLEVELIKYSKNYKNKYLISYGAYLNSLIFGLHLQKNYKKINYVEHYKTIILNDISILEKILKY